MLVVEKLSLKEREAGINVDKVVSTLGWNYEVDRRRVEFLNNWNLKSRRIGTPCESVLVWAGCMDQGGQQ